MNMNHERDPSRTGAASNGQIPPKDSFPTQDPFIGKNDLLNFEETDQPGKNHHVKFSPLVCPQYNGVINVNQILEVDGLPDIDTLRKLPTKFKLFKESLRQNDDFLLVVFDDYCLFFEAILPPKFKISDFLKYDDISFCRETTWMKY